MSQHNLHHNFNEAHKHANATSTYLDALRRCLNADNADPSYIEEVERLISDVENFTGRLDALHHDLANAEIAAADRRF